MQKKKRLAEKDMHTDMALKKKRKALIVDPEDKDTTEV